MRLCRGFRSWGLIPVKWYLCVLDWLAWFAAIMFAGALLFDFRLNRIPWESEVILVAILGVIQALVGWLLYVYRGKHGRGSFEEALALASSSFITGGIGWVGTLFFGPQFGIPRSLVLAAAPIAVLLQFAVRYAARLVREKDAKPAPDAEPILIIGAGHVGTRLAEWMGKDAASNLKPVAYLDDDPQKKHFQDSGVKVEGKISDLVPVANRHGAKKAVIAIGDPSPQLVRTVQDMATREGIRVKVMPAMDELLARGVRGQDLRDLEIEDLLGRPPVDTHVDEVAGYLEGKRVLVTGAGGSIGSQLCVEINKYNPAELIMLDRDETGLQEAQLSTFGTGLLDSPEVVLADIRDRDALNQIFADRKPEVVFHAAALKHLPMLEQYPDEAWKTNVFGTLNVLEVARDNDVETFINISTDKAANPTSVLGFSKRVAERLTSWMAKQTGGEYISVRFGNVIGSRGSMLPTFTRLAREGKPLTVTHPDATRYFMTIPEACQLVLQAGGIGRGSEVLILDMGEPVRIMEIAEYIVSMADRPIPIHVTGLREGEKIHEELVGDEENAERPLHSKIAHAKVPPTDPIHLDKSEWDRVVATHAQPDPRSIPTPVEGIGVLGRSEA